jgi:transposase
VVAHVPWARHSTGHTHTFDDQVAWLATQCSKSAVTELMRIAWRTVGAIVARVWADTAVAADQFAGLTRIGIDEISYRRGHMYLLVVVDHDTGRLVWAAPGKSQATLRGFFDALEASGPGRCAQITHVSADGAAWISNVVDERCPAAVQAADPFHVVKWANEALDALRRDAWHQARRATGGTRVRGRHAGIVRVDSVGNAQYIARSRYALRKNPENLTVRQQVKLEWIAKNDPRLYRGYLLKEGLRTILKLPPEEAPEALDAWIRWARRCRIESFVALQRRIVSHRDRILAAIDHGLSNGRIESVNTKIRLITRTAFGFASPEPLIAMAMLSLGGSRPSLPGR